MLNGNLFPTTVDLFQATVDLFQATVHLFKATEYLFQATVYLFQATVDLYQATVDLFQVTVDLFQATVDLLHPTVGDFVLSLHLNKQLLVTYLRSLRRYVDYCTMRFVFYHFPRYNLTNIEHCFYVDIEYSTKR